MNVTVKKDKGYHHLYIDDKFVCCHSLPLVGAHLKR